MDPQIKQRLTTAVTVYPCSSIVDGDKVFGTSYTLYGYVVPKVSTTINRDGIIKNIKTAIYLDGNDLALISSDHEVVIPFHKRSAIQQINGIPGLVSAYELLEVLL